jgi:hypothetical protein
MDTVDFNIFWLPFLKNPKQKFLLASLKSYTSCDKYFQQPSSVSLFWFFDSACDDSKCCSESRL